MKAATLIFLIDKASNKICLGMKKRGFGVNRWNGYGGKQNEGESIIEAAVREIREESQVVVSAEDLTKVAVLMFKFPNSSDWDQEVTVYLTEKWSGDPVETEEMKPDWFNIDNLPFDSMWADDSVWLPKVLKGEKLYGEFTFTEGDKLLSYDLKLL